MREKEDEETRFGKETRRWMNVRGKYARGPEEEEEEESILSAAPRERRDGVLAKRTGRRAASSPERGLNFREGR